MPAEGRALKRLNNRRTSFAKRPTADINEIQMSTLEISPRMLDDAIGSRSRVLKEAVKRMQVQILIVHGPTNTGKTFLLQQLQTELSKTHDIISYSAKTHRDAILEGPTTWWSGSIGSENKSAGNRAVLIDDAHLLYEDYVFWNKMREFRWCTSPEPLICMATRYVLKVDNTGATGLEVNTLLRPSLRNYEYRTVSLEVGHPEELSEKSKELPLGLSFREVQEWIAGVMEDRGYRPTEWTGLVSRLYGTTGGHVGALKVMTDWLWPAEMAESEVGISEGIHRLLADLGEKLPTSSPPQQTPEAGLLHPDKPSDSVRHPNDESGELMKVLSSHISYLGLPTDDHLRDDSVREVLEYVLQQKNPYKEVEGDGLEVCLQEGYLLYRGFAGDGYQFPSRLHHFFCYMRIFGKGE